MNISSMAVCFGLNPSCKFAKKKIGEKKSFEITNFFSNDVWYHTTIPGVPTFSSSDLPWLICHFICQCSIPFRCNFIFSG